jgi:hypothetical protein
MISPSPVSPAGPGPAVPPGGPQAGSLVIPGVGVGGTGSGSGSGEGMTGFPMGGGLAGNGGGQERSRQPWEPEDSDIWAGSDDGPSVGGTPRIGADGVINAEAAAGDAAVPAGVVPGDASPWEPAAAPPAADDAGFLAAGSPGDNQQPNAPTRQAWMDEAPDIWGDDGQDVAPIIG